MATDDLGNQQVAFEWGNFPQQSNNGRFTPPLSTGDSHDISSTKWNNYPDELWKSINYMVTSAEYLGNDIYEYTADNELEVGMSVRTTGCPGFNGVADVVYADKQKFRTLNELPGNTKITGLLGRVDVMPTEPGLFHGRTRTTDGGAPTFIWPATGLCFNDVKTPGDTWQDMLEYLRSCGVDPAILKEATFVGGEDKYDWQGGEYDDSNQGILFWNYIAKDEVMYVDWETGYVLTGKDFDGKMVGGNPSWGDTVLTEPEFIDDLFFTAFTNDPAKNNTSGWL
jgi:hypothetical protein